MNQAPARRTMLRQCLVQFFRPFLFYLRLAMKTSLKTAALKIFMASALIPAAAANANVMVGGGSTLPVPLYSDVFTHLLNPDATAHVYSYTGVGSGNGKKAFFENNASYFGSIGSVHFAGSDSRVSVAEQVAYATAEKARSDAIPPTPKWGPFVQIPAVATSVVLPYKHGAVADLNLTTEQICKIYSRQFTVWHQINAAYAFDPIKIIYREDNSGTTELLANYLRAGCAPYSIDFTVSNDFKKVVASAGVDAAALKAEGTWVSGRGSGGVKAAIATNSNVLAYLSPDPSYVHVHNSAIARINTFLPVNADIQTALNSITIPAGAASNPRNWVPAYTLPTTGYPIFGTTNFLVGQCYATAAKKDGVRHLLSRFYGDGSAGSAAIAINIAEHNFVELPTSWKNAIKANFLAASGSLAIGDASVCNGIGRP